LAVGYRKLGVRTGHRKALLRNLVTALFRDGKITTTEPRAKEVRSIAEKMVTLAKRGDLAARRQVLGYIYDEDVVRKLFSTIGPRYTNTPGGYTRIMKLGERRGDAAEMVVLELV
jgi:large subunit ribosomal protein L17